MFNLSEPVTSYSYLSHSADSLQLTINELDQQPSYVSGSMLLQVCEDELLPLYTEEFDDEILQLSGFRSRVPTPSGQYSSQYIVEELQPSFSTYMCIHRFA